MSSYKLSRRADRELLEIYLYGLEQFGPLQAARYKAELDRCFELLASMPRMGRAADHLRQGVRRHEHVSHVILYKEFKQHIRILAIVHGSSVRRLKL